MEREEIIEKFSEFLNEFYIDELVTALTENKKSISIDFTLLDKFDVELADCIFEMPNEFIEAAEEAVKQIDTGLGEAKLRVRFFNLPKSKEIRIRNIRSEHIGKLLIVDGIVKRASEIRPEVYEGIFVCPECGARISVIQTDQMMRSPTRCDCGCKRGFKLIDQRMYDARWITIEEPFEITAGEQPSDIMVFLKEDLTSPIMQSRTDPGNRIKVVGVLKQIPKRVRGTKSRQLEIYIDANYIEPIEVGWEELEITPEDERRIIELSKDPLIYDKLVASIAPAIYGLNEVKEAIILQMFSGEPHILKDGTRIRGNIHILLVGDPSCLVADERVVMANGTIMKIGEMGSKHLEKIDYKVHTGMGRNYGRADVFHVYKKQPIIEIITETGKSIRGTYNQPVLIVENTQQFWRRLDEVKIGDRVQVLPKIECRKKSLVKTGWTDYPYYHKSWHVKIPKFVDEKLAALFGYILADGWVTKHRIGFVVNNDESDIVPKINKYFKDCFDVPVSNYKHSRASKRVTYYQVDRTHIARLLPFLNERRVPNYIFQSRNSVVASFLRWLYEGYGSVFSKGRGRTSVSLKSNSIELLRDVQLLLLRFGIHSRILWEDKGRTTKIKGRKIKGRKISAKPSGSLIIKRSESIIKFWKHIGFASKKKNDRLKNAVEYAKNHIHRAHKSRTEKIVKINKLPPQDVFDIEVPEYHRFVANGIIVHNTAKSQIMKLASTLIPRGKYASGTAVTGVGLTASVTRDEQFFGGWVLEAGALVLANKSICAIDEFSHVSPGDMIKLQEAMSLESYHPKTEITLLNGKSLTIQKLVESLLERHKDKVKIGDECVWLKVPETLKILTTDFSRIYPTKIVRVSKHTAPEFFYRIKINTGREVLVTPNHPCFVLDGDINCVRADEVKHGDYMPIPSSIPLDGTPQKFEINRAEVRSPVSATRIIIPNHNSPELCKFLGYMVSDGCGYTTRGREYGICFTNSNKRILKDFEFITKNLFGLKPSKISRRERRSILYYNSVELYNFLKKIEPKLLAKSWKKELPKWVKGLPREEIKCLLRAAFDGDGSTTGEVVTYTTTSEYLALQIQELLNIVGVLSSLRKRLTQIGRLYLDVTIKGVENLDNFVKKVGFSEESKNRKIRAYIENAKYKANFANIIPNVQGRVQFVLKKLKAYQKEVAGFMLTDYFNRKRNFTILVLRRIVENLMKRIKTLEFVRENVKRANSRKELRFLRKKARVSTSEMAKKMEISHQMVSYLETKSKSFPFEKYKKALTECINEMIEVKRELDKLRKLAFSKIRWSKVTSVEKVRNENIKWVYDVTTENEKFISNCMVLHNTISIAKASIVATLPAQTAILAGANPKFGRFDPYIPIKEQLDINDVLLSRFDLRFALRDVPNPELDGKIADHILKMRHFEEEAATPAIDPMLLRKYIAYTRANVHPVLTKEAGEKLKEFYLQMRSRSGEDSPVSITLRQYDSLIRLSEASAKIRLSDTVDIEDAQRAINLMSFSLRQFGFEPETGKIDIDRVEGQRMTSAQRSKTKIMLDVINTLEAEVGKDIPKEEVIRRAREEGLDNAEEMLNMMLREGILYQPNPNVVRKI